MNDSDDLVRPGFRPSLKRRLLWIGGVTGVILLMIFVPPLINANRYRLRIARSMSASLGRPVHLDDVRLTLLPIPGLALRNLVVSEDPSFGDEPTIRADSVEATLRLSSLWRGHLEFSTIRFIEPHVNLVRNAEGRWNLADVLLHASRLDTAPTAQPHAGPAPRFPYIEATGGRVNLKLSQEKLPFAVTDADFALWLPSPRVWRVRLTGQPARTDMNVNDPGVVRVEGELERAGSAADVPVNFRASWHNAPMGQASQIITDQDLGWRGTLNFDGTLAGTLGAAQLKTKLTLNDLRRSDFAAAHPLDLQISCAAGLAASSVTLQNLLCTMPDNATTPMALEASSVDLAHPAQADVTLKGEKIPVRWGLLWAALFSPRVATDLHPAGTIDINFRHSLAAPAVTMERKPGAGHKFRAAAAGVAAAGPVSPWDQWTGTVQLALPAVSTGFPGQPPSPAGALPLQLVWTTGAPQVPGLSSGEARPPVFHLQPVSIHLAPDATVLVNASVSGTGYTLAVTGTASAAALLLPARYLPQLGDGLNDILPFPPTGLAPVRVDFTCTHPWGAVQTCTSLRPVPAGKGTPLMLVPQNPRPATDGPRLAPGSLSPYDQASPSGDSPPQPPSPRF